jgi:hypothetical protein
MTSDLDLRIPDEIQRHLEEVDDAIDAARRNRVERAGPAELAVVPGRVVVRSRRPGHTRVAERPSARLVASVAIVVSAVVAFGWLESSSVGTGGPGSSAAAGVESGTGSLPSPSAPPSASVEPTPTLPAPKPQATLATVRIVRSDASALTILRKELRSTCLRKPVLDGPTPQKAFIVAAASRAEMPGWLDAAQTVWLDQDATAAARGFGSAVLVIGQDGSWVIIPGGATASARELLSMKVSTGVAFWLGARISTGSCP